MHDVEFEFWVFGQNILQLLWTGIVRPHSTKSSGHDSNSIIGAAGEEMKSYWNTQSLRSRKKRQIEKRHLLLCPHKMAIIPQWHEAFRFQIGHQYYPIAIDQ